METLTTEQELLFDFSIVDGRGRPVEIDGDPVGASSDETVATVAITLISPGKYHGVVSSVTPSPDGSTQRITITADADVSATVQEVVGFFDFNVTLDPRTSARMINLVTQPAVDKAV